MHRQPLLELLEVYQHLWPEEASVVTRIRDLVTEHPDCFERTCQPGHVTGSAWVVSHDGSQHLLLHHRKLDKWLQPGGHADGESDIAQVAVREANEESGLPNLRLVTSCPPAGLLDIDVHPIPARRTTSGELIDLAHDHHDLRFLIQCETATEPIVSDESHAVRWFSSQEVRQQTTEPSVLRLLTKATRHLAPGQ